MVGLFSERSSVDDCSLFYKRGESIFEAVEQTKSFKFGKVVFYLIDKIPQIYSKIPTGEFAIHRGDTVLHVLRRLFARNRLPHKFTIPEGWTVLKIVEKVRNNDLLFGEITTIPPEGSLMPNTYFYYFGDTKESLLKQAQNQMTQFITHCEKINKTNLKISDILILASIIEKETHFATERSLVASVYHNRLAKNMRLQADPTVIYERSNGYGALNRPLSLADLKGTSTYGHKGLPPTPICCPGRAAIEAALNPQSTDYLFFVLRPDKTGHNFSKTYEEHIKNVKKARRCQQNK